MLSSLFAYFSPTLHGGWGKEERKHRIYPFRLSRSAVVSGECAQRGFRRDQGENAPVKWGRHRKLKQIVFPRVRASSKLARERERERDREGKRNVELSRQFLLLESLSVARSLSWKGDRATRSPCVCGRQESERLNVSYI